MMSALVFKELKFGKLITYYYCDISTVSPLRNMEKKLQTALIYTMFSNLGFFKTSKYLAYLHIQN